MRKIFLPLIIVIFFCTPLVTVSIRPVLSPTDNALDQLIVSGFVYENTPIKLHLGCGQQHFPTYINIDYPSTEHTVQTIIGADVFADITMLKFPAKSIAEVRSHHVFEHFDRQSTLAMLCAWHEWLQVGGKLIIETPDFFASLEILLNTNLNYHEKQIVLRHIFGSHEARWAIHCDGWYQEKFEYILKKLGFECVKITKNSWNRVQSVDLINNITIEAVKKLDMPREELIKYSYEILRDYLVNSSLSEEKMWSVWCAEFKKSFQQLVL